MAFMQRRTRRTCAVYAVLNGVDPVPDGTGNVCDRIPTLRLSDGLGSDSGGWECNGACIGDEERREEEGLELHRWARPRYEGA